MGKKYFSPAVQNLHALIPRNFIPEYVSNLITLPRFSFHREFQNEFKGLERGGEVKRG